MDTDLDLLRSLTISQTLFRPTSLKKAMGKLGFVQADPIRSPARAQDLVLRHRVKGYHAGDLEREYLFLDLEEDYLYAHGFVTRGIWQLLHPRPKVKLAAFDRRVLETVRKLGKVHPKDLLPHFNGKLTKNWWGGSSHKTKMSLDWLHYFGLLKVAKRQNGIRIYEFLDPVPNPLSIEERLNKLTLAMVNLLAPVSPKTLHQALHSLRRHFGQTRPAVESLVESGQLVKQHIDGVSYLWPGQKPRREEMRDEVRFLAPFDPLVWDRARFEHLWGWKYRFEAYTPKEKRIRGYYAMPLLWGNNVIGWANIKKLTGEIDVDLGFIHKRPKEKVFESELEKEVGRLEQFLS